MKVVAALVSLLALSLTGSIDLPGLDGLGQRAAPDVPGEGKIDALLAPLGMSVDDVPRDAKALTTGSLLNTKTIQPGAYVDVGPASCTLNYVFRGGGQQYIGTAAHCVEDYGGLGMTVRDVEGNPFGTVVAYGDQDVVAQDWALIRIHSAYYSKVTPAMRGHPDMPTGYTRASQTAAGDVVSVSGYGLGAELTSTSRENRYATLLSDDSKTFVLAPSTAIMGDSGGPFVHVATGKALGIVSRGYINPVIGDDTGPTVEGMMAQMAAKGFALTLATA